MADALAGDFDRFDVSAVRAEFPAFGRRVHGKPLVYLDSASTTQKPASVIGAMRRAYEATANVHRAVHALGVEATAAFENARRTVARRVGAFDPGEIVFVRGATEGINLVAQAWGRREVQRGDEILVTELEHHSNLVPWQMLCEEKGARLMVLPIDARGDIALEHLAERLSGRTRLVALAHVSNSLGTVVPVAEIARRAKEAGAVVLVDGAQAAAHLPIDVASLGCDFYALSAHKAYGPTGVGALWGRRALLEGMPPWQGGGEMVVDVGLERSTFQPPPYRFEAGTPDVIGAIGFAAAIGWLEGKGIERLAAHERALLEQATRVLGAMDRVRLVGTAREKVAVVSFVVDGMAAADVASALDREGVAVRAGSHCAQPALAHFGLEATVRASFGAYSNEDDVAALAGALDRAIRTHG